MSHLDCSDKSARRAATPGPCKGEFHGRAFSIWKKLDVIPAKRVHNLIVLRMSDSFVSISNNSAEKEGKRWRKQEKRAISSYIITDQAQNDE